MALLLSVAYARIATSEEFCAHHNCIVDHIYYRNAATSLSSAQYAAMQNRGGIIGPLGSPSEQEDAVVALETEVNLPLAPSMGVVPPLPSSRSPSGIVMEWARVAQRKLLKATEPSAAATVSALIMLLVWSSERL